MQASPSVIRHWPFVTTGLLSLVACWLLTGLVSAQAVVPLPPVASKDTPITTRNVTAQSYLPSYPTGSLQINGKWAYLGMGSELVALDLTEPTAPRVVGHIPVPGLMLNYTPPAPLLLYGHYALIATAQNVYALDVADPTQMREVGTLAFDTYISAIAIADQRLFVGVSTDLWVVDLTQPEAMRISGHFELPGFVSSIDIVGTNAYVVANGLSILDISPSAGPNLALRSHVAGLNARKVIATATALYLIHSPTQSAITVVDISDPLRPVIAGSYVYQGSNRFGQLIDAAVLGDQLILVDGDELQVIDFSDPAAPQKVNTVAQPRQRIIPSIHVAEDRIYVTDEELTIYTMPTPGNLVEIGSYTMTFHDATDVVVSDRYAFVATITALAVVDFMTATAPQQVANLTQPLIGNLYELAATQSMLYAAGASYLYAFDMSNPISPQVTDVYSDTQVGSSFYQIAAADQLVFVAENKNDEQHLLILDASTPTRLAPLSRQKLPERLLDLATDGEYVYVTDGPFFHVIEITTPALPTIVGRYTNPTQQFMGPLALAGHYAYVKSADTQISIIDLTTPSNPTLVNTIRYPTSWRRLRAEPPDLVDLAVEGHYLYLSDQFRGILIFDVADPTAPFEVGRYAPATRPDLTVADRQLFVAQGSAGVDLLTFQPPVTTATADETGGKLMVTHQPISYTFPAGVFSTTALITHTTRYLEDDEHGLGRLVAIGTGFMVTATTAGDAQPLPPSQPYTITIGYRVEDLGAAREESLALYRWDGREWQLETTSRLDQAGQRMVVTPTHLGFFALLGQTHTFYLPVVLQRSGPQ